ncbi:MAG TPA: hypothetical protein VGC18_12970 [Lacisediminihabitans sp.]|uniref:hypothetical protein n=1 Tax=Lacisediminihabitans sp. TaxID=2787631 RepID=UPI002ED86F2D
MAKTPNIDPEQMRADALKIKDALTEQASRAALKAADLTGQGIDWAAPKAQQAFEKTIERATPAISSAAERAQAAADAAKPFIDDVQGKVVDDYLPRINKAVSDATTAATTDADLAERARLVREASTHALTTPTAITHPVVKHHRVAKALGWTALGASAAGVGYLLWKRSQPIEDPWAEEYWADLDTDAPVPDVAPEPVDDIPTPVNGTEQIVTDEVAEAGAEDEAESPVSEETPESK